MKRNPKNGTPLSVDPIAAVLRRIATDPAAAGAVALIGQLHTAPDLPALDKAARQLHGSGLPNAWVIEVCRALARNRRRLGDTDGAHWIEGYLSAPDGQTLCAIHHDFHEADQESFPGMNVAFGTMVDVLAPVTAAKLVAEAEAAPDLRALYRVARAVEWLELDKEQSAPVDAAVALARARLAPATPASRALRATLNRFRAFWDEATEGLTLIEECDAELMDWYIAACSPGGPGLDTGCPFPERVGQEPEIYHAPETLPSTGGAL